MPRAQLPQRQGSSDCEKLRERALRCRRLADGVGDPQFAVQLKAISDEYEDRAVKIEQGLIPRKIRRRRIRLPCC